MLQFLVISFSAFSFVIAVMILSKFGMKADAKQRRINYIGGIHEHSAFSELETSFFKRFLKSASKSFSKALEKALPKNKSKNTEKNKNATLERQLRLAGIYISPQEFAFIKTAFMLISTILFLLIGLVLNTEIFIKFLVILIGLIIGLLGPNLFLKSKVTSHQQKIREQLPDVMDLLGVCIEAGLSFDMALIKISEKLKGAFVDELLIVHREIQMGLSRRQALQNLSNSSDIPELKTFAAALAQAEQLGIPINNVMRVQSEQLRVTRKQIAQEKGMKAPVKMMLPMVAFVFPVIFIILMGPTVLNLIEQFRS